MLRFILTTSPPTRTSEKYLSMFRSSKWSSLTAECGCRDISAHWDIFTLLRKEDRILPNGEQRVLAFRRYVAGGAAWPVRSNASLDVSFCHRGRSLSVHGLWLALSTRKAKSDRNKYTEAKEDE